MTENQERMRALLDDTLAEEPPLVDLVPGAVAGAERGRRRGRIMAGGAAVAVLAVAVGAYGMVGKGGHSDSGTGPVAGPAGPGPASETSTEGKRGSFGIPGLFDHPGTPQEECAKVRGPLTVAAKQPSVEEERSYCARLLTQLRALLPDAVVVLQPSVDFGQPNWSAPLVGTPDGGTVPGFADAYQKAAKDPSKVVYETTHFAFRSPRGEGTVYYETTPPGFKAKPEAGGNLPLGDGTSAHFAQQAGGDIHMNGVTAAGLWYDMAISGVYPVYGASGSTLQPDLKSDGLDHEVFPDGHVTVYKPGQSAVMANPYRLSEIQGRIAARGPGDLVKAIGAHPLSVAAVS